MKLRLSEMLMSYLIIEVFIDFCCVCDLGERIAV